jgi:putative transposase
LSNPEIAERCLNYIHQNPVVEGFFEKAEDWFHSRAGKYFGVRKSLIDLIMI